jgi:hypothetical protein
MLLPNMKCFRDAIFLLRSLIGMLKKWFMFFRVFLGTLVPSFFSLFNS